MVHFDPGAVPSRDPKVDGCAGVLVHVAGAYVADGDGVVMISYSLSN